MAENSHYLRLRTSVPAQKVQVEIRDRTRVKLVVLLVGRTVSCIFVER